MRSQPAQQLVGLVLTPEVEVILVGLERPKPGEGIGQGFQQHLRSPADQVQLGDHTLQRLRGETVPHGKDQRIVRPEPLFLKSPRWGQADRHDRSRLDSAEAGDLLQLAQLLAEPRFCGGAVNEQRGIAHAEVLFVILADFGLVALEERMQDLEPSFEEVLLPREDTVGVALVVDQVQPELGASARRGRRGRLASAGA